MDDIYETKISDQRWIAYDIPGNIGWIMYMLELALCFVKQPEFMQSHAIFVLILLAVIPALLMLIGIGELISERVLKLDRVLPKKRLLRGFGVLTCGGAAGMALSVIALIVNAATVNADCTLLVAMGSGAILCTVFSGLLYGGYRKIRRVSPVFGKEREQNADR